MAEAQQSVNIVFACIARFPSKIMLRSSHLHITRWKLQSRECSVNFLFVYYHPRDGSRPIDDLTDVHLSSSLHEKLVYEWYTRLALLEP